MSRVQITDTVIQPAPEYLKGVDGASVTVTQRGGGAASLFQTETGGGTWANPLVTRDGRIEPNEQAGAPVWLNAGSYDLVISANGAGSYTTGFEAISGNEYQAVVYEQPDQPTEPVDVGALWIDTDAPIPPSDVTVLMEAPVNADNHATVQAAVDHAATASKGAVYIPSGVRTLPATGLVIPNTQTELTVFGDGKRTELRVPNTAGAVGIDIAGPGTVIRELYVKGGASGGAGADSHAIRFKTDAHLGRVIDVYIEDSGDNGIDLTDAIGVEIVRPHIVNAGNDGIHAGGTYANQLRVLGGWIQSCAGNGIYCGRVEHPLIDGVALEDNGTASAGTAQIKLFETLYPEIRGNYIEHGHDYDILVDDGGGGYAMEGSIVENEFQYYAAGGATINVYLKRCHRFEMARNRFAAGLSGATNLRCDVNTTALRLRKHQFPGAVTFAHPYNTAIAEGRTMTTAASAALELPGSRVVEVTGGVTITSFTEVPGEITRTLIFRANITIVHGNNISLAGAVNCVRTAGTTLSFAFDGTKWVETSRSPA